ncbi:hypothetical protein WJX84_012435 [Apatococcus fuscideae]|uniref:Uncharacterized protein n=1 Tax=Apatococcus fuscideae TaxID=2026836 RepID=A0AAW1T0U8_9CHLO
MFAHSTAEKRESPYATRGDEVFSGDQQHLQASPGPMTIDLSSLFSGARRVKGGKTRGGTSSSSAQISDDVHKESPARRLMSGSEVAQIGDDNPQPLQPSRPLEQAPSSITSGRPQPSWAKAQRADGALRGVPGSPAQPPKTVINLLPSDQAGQHHSEPEAVAAMLGTSHPGAAAQAAVVYTCTADLSIYPE